MPERTCSGCFLITSAEGILKDERNHTIGNRTEIFDLSPF